MTLEARGIGEEEGRHVRHRERNNCAPKASPPETLPPFSAPSLPNNAGYLLEAALKAGNPASMISILNTLRATAVTIGTLSYAANALPPLTDPGTADGRINLLFREKAFWTFTRGQRLNDLRRLIRQYGRTADQVFPVGNHYRGTTYHDDVNLPITTNESNGNPNFTSCTDRKA